MMHRAWNSIEEVPYCFSRSYVKLQGHTALKIVDFDPKWPFPDCNSSLESPMATKWCTKLEVALKRCPIVFQGHPSNFKVTRDKTSPILTQIGRFRTIGRLQLSNPSDLPCFSKNTLFKLDILKNINAYSSCQIFNRYHIFDWPWYGFGALITSCDKISHCVMYRGSDTIFMTGCVREIRGTIYCRHAVPGKSNPTLSFSRMIPRFECIANYIGVPAVINRNMVR